jgi:hypothetical protein
MKNPVSNFLCFVCLSLTGLVSACNLAPVEANEAPMPGASSALPSPRVRIIHTWTDHTDGAVYAHSEFGLGTAVGPSLILTHNHFDFPPERRENEALTFITPTGQTFSLPLSDVAMVAIDGGTQMIYLPSYVILPVAPVGDEANLGQLAEGAWLEVDLWDDAHQRFGRASFQIKHIEQGVATLADPRRLVRPGDSGGGIYVEGKLIGNTWAMFADPENGRPTGTFNVALLPTGAMALLQSELAGGPEALPAGASALASGQE